MIHQLYLLRILYDLDLIFHEGYLKCVGAMHIKINRTL